MQIIPEWRQGWRYWSAQANALGLVLLTLSSEALPLWNMLPGEARTMLPGWISYPFFVAALALRFIRQQREVRPVKADDPPG